MLCPHNSRYRPSSQCLRKDFEVVSKQAIRLSHDTRNQAKGAKRYRHRLAIGSSAPNNQRSVANLCRFIHDIRVLLELPQYRLLFRVICYSPSSILSFDAHTLRAVRSPEQKCHCCGHGKGFRVPFKRVVMFVHSSLYSNLCTQYKYIGAGLRLPARG